MAFRKAVLVVFALLALTLLCSGLFSRSTENDAPELTPESAVTDAVNSEYGEELREPQSAIAVAGEIGVCRLTVPAGTELKLLSRENDRYTVEKDGETFLVEDYAVAYEEKNLPGTGKALYDDTELYSTLLNKGEEVNVLTDGKRLCLVSVRGSTGTVPRWAVCLSGEEPVSPQTGYAKKGASFWRDSGMCHAPTELSEDESILVLAETDLGVVTEVGGRTGYMLPSDILSDAQEIDGETFEVPDYQELMPDWTSPAM